jgi:hypothetical protein
VILLQALLWFKSPPRYFARCTRRAAAEQVAALETFTQELTKTLKMGVAYAGKGSGLPGDLAWPSYRSPAAAELGRAAGRLCRLGSARQCRAATRMFSLSQPLGPCFTSFLLLATFWACVTAPFCTVCCVAVYVCSRLYRCSGQAAPGVGHACTRGRPLHPAAAVPVWGGAQQAEGVDRPSETC